MWSHHIKPNPCKLSLVRITVALVMARLGAIYVIADTKRKVARRALNEGVERRRFLSGSQKHTHGFWRGGIGVKKKKKKRLSNQTKYSSLWGDVLRSGNLFVLRLYLESGFRDVDGFKEREGEGRVSLQGGSFILCLSLFLHCLCSGLRNQQWEGYCRWARFDFCYEPVHLGAWGFVILIPANACSQCGRNTAVLLHLVLSFGLPLCNLDILLMIDCWFHISDGVAKSSLFHHTHKKKGSLFSF